MNQDNQLKIVLGTVVLVLATLFFIKVFDLSYPLSIVTTNRSSELSVVGEGKIDAVPDIAHIDAGVSVANAATVEDAQSTINKINGQIVKAAQALGIKKEDISTSNYSINPTYTYPDNVQQLTGYSGNVTVSLKVRNTKMVTQVLTAVTKAGANQIQNVQFSIDNPDKLREEARNKAIQNAKDQAARLANTLGIKLGKIVNISESNSSSSQLPLYRSGVGEMSAGVADSAPVEPGSQTVNSTVTLFFERK